MEKPLININIVLSSQLKRIIGKDEIIFEIAAGSNFKNLAAELSRVYGQAVKEILFSEKYGFIWLCVRNRRRVLPDEMLEDGDKVIFLPPLSGG